MSVFVGTLPLTFSVGVVMKEGRKSSWTVEQTGCDSALETDNQRQQRNRQKYKNKMYDEGS